MTDPAKSVSFATGAEAMVVGQLQGLALAAGGEGGLTRILEILEDEARTSLGLLGRRNWKALEPAHLHPAPPVAEPHALSAFPLLGPEFRS